MCDLNDDGSVSKSEILRIFLASFVQDSDGEMKIGNTINNIFDNDVKEFTKAKAYQVLMSGMNDTTLKEFMAALLQSHHKLRT
jgi:hypothetical protein